MSNLKKTSTYLTLEQREARWKRIYHMREIQAKSVQEIAFELKVSYERSTQLIKKAILFVEGPPAD